MSCRAARETGSVGIGGRAFRRGGYRRSRFLVRRSPSCRLLRGNRGVSVPTVGDSGAAFLPLCRRSAILAQPSSRFTDGPGIPRAVPPSDPCAQELPLADF